MTLPELLAPAGNLEKLQAALLYGARAVYLGGPGLNLRAAPAHLPWDDVDRAVALATQAGAKVYYCLNAIVGQQALAGVEAQLERLAHIPVAALIVADPGVVHLARRRLPHVPLHLSTQASTMNAAALAFWQDQGVRRVNLARELSARDMKALARANPGVELEVFVHGAMCLAVSGHCLLSSWLRDRSGNRGDCCHPCRFDYRPFPGAMPSVRLDVEEALRPGEVTWEIEQSQGFSQLFAPMDLCLVKYLPWFARQGFAALKIEGRMKSPLYVAQVVDVYATALADVAAGHFRPAVYLEELARAATRPLGSGFFLGHGHDGGTARRRTFFEGRPALAAPLAAKVLEPLGPGRWRIQAKGRFQATDSLELMLPGLRRPALPPGSYALEDESGARLDVLHPGCHAVLRADEDQLRSGIFIRRTQEI